MNCTQSRQYYLRSQLGAAHLSDYAEFKKHTENCAACQVFLSATVLQNTRGYTYDEISGALESAQGTYRYRLIRAHEALKPIL